MWGLEDSSSQLVRALVGMAAASAGPIDYASGDHYHVLGVARGASEGELTRAYKALARKHHPDKNPDNKEAAEVSFKRVAEAYRVLRDPRLRAEYDRKGQRSYVSYEEAERLFRQYQDSADDEDGIGGLNFDEERRKKGMGLIALILLLVFKPRVMTLAPLLCVVYAAYWLYKRDRPVPPWAWVVIALLSFFTVKSLVSGRQARQVIRAPQQWAEASEGLTGKPHSGELRVDDIADPRAGVAREEGWAQALLDSLQEAIVQVQDGQGQVAIVFSRQGCPWCDRQLPVLHNSLQRHARSKALCQQALRGSTADADSDARNSSKVGEDKLPPLRIFMLDQEEFPTVAGQFQISGFPTTVVFGAPGVKPLLIAGFLDDDGFEELLREAQSAPPIDEDQRQTSGSK